jgi:hypothetical protein
LVVWLRAMAAAVLVLVGAGAVLVSTAFNGQPTAHALGAASAVDPGARDPGDISANNSPTLVQNPVRADNLAVSDRIDSPAFSCALQVSIDAGAHWSRVPVPIPRGEERKCYAPDLAFASDGTLYMSYVTLRGEGNVPHAAWLVSSRDGGRTLTTPRRVLGKLAFHVRLTTDPARPNRLYLTWLQAADVGLYRFTAPGNPIEVTRSDDGGRTWQPPAHVSDPSRGRVIAPVPAVGPGAKLYVLYLDLGNDRLDYEGAHGGLGGPPYAGRFTLVLGRSEDAGVSWQQSVVDSQLVPTQRFISFLPMFPSLAIDRRSGRIYAAYQDASLSPSDVYLWSLSPGQAGWNGPTRVNDTPVHDGSSQYLPQIAVAPSGRLDVEYYDRRADHRNRFNTVSLQSSFDGGGHFTKHVSVSDRSFDSGIGSGSERGLPDLGSRLALVASDPAALAAWTDTRAGTVASNKQDIAFARVEFSDPTRLSSAARNALRYGGIAVALLGAALLLARAAPRYLRTRVS